MSKRRVVVTGLGVLAPNGNDVGAYWEALVNGRSGIAPITRFDTADFKVKIAGEVKGFDPTLAMDRKEVRRNDGFVHYAVYVAQQAAEAAALDVSTLDAERVGVIFGSGIGGISTLEDQCAVLREKGPDRLSPFLIPMMICDMAAGGQISRAAGRGRE